MYIYIYSNASCPQLVPGSKLHELVAIGSPLVLADKKRFQQVPEIKDFKKKSPMPKSAAAFFLGKNNTCQRFAAAFNALKVWDLVLPCRNCGKKNPWVKLLRRRKQLTAIQVKQGATKPPMLGRSRWIFMGFSVKNPWNGWFSFVLFEFIQFIEVDETTYWNYISGNY